MLGKIEGKWRRGQQRIKWLDKHHWINDHEFEQTPRIVKDREAYCTAVHGVTKSQTWLSNWITTTTKYSTIYIYSKWLLYMHPWLGPIITWTLPSFTSRFKFPQGCLLPRILCLKTGGRFNLSVVEVSLQGIGITFTNLCCCHQCRHLCWALLLPLSLPGTSITAERDIWEPMRIL